MLKERAVAQQVQTGEAIKSEPMTAFSKRAKAEGFTQFSHNLHPKNGGAPNISFINPTSGDSVLVNLSKAVSDSVNKNELSLTDLLGLQVVDGANAAGEPRFYLARNTREVFNIDEVIAASEAVSKVVKVSLADAIKKAGAGALI